MYFHCAEDEEMHNLTDQRTTSGKSRWATTLFLELEVGADELFGFVTSRSWIIAVHDEYVSIDNIALHT